MEHPQGTNAGIYAFTGRCASCHDTRKDGAPDRYALNRRTPEEVLASMTTGSMAQYAHGLTEYEKRVVAVYVGGRPLGSAASRRRVADEEPLREPSAFPAVTGRRVERMGIRHCELALSDRSCAWLRRTCPKLTLKWAFGFPNGNSAYGQPVVVGGRVFVGADTGFVYALDAASGCIYWSFRAAAGVRTAVSIGEGNASASVARLLRRREGQCVRGGCRDRRPGVEGADRHASGGARHGRADARGRAAVRADVVARGIGCRATRAIPAARSAAASSRTTPSPVGVSGSPTRFSRSPFR